MGYARNPTPHVTGRDFGPFAGYSGGSYYDPDQLEGIFSAIGGAVKGVARGAARVGKFAVKRGAPLAIGAIPVVGGAASRAYAGLVSPTTGRTTAGGTQGGTVAYRTASIARPVPVSMTFFDRVRAAAQAAAARGAEDPRVREYVVSRTAEYAPPSLLAAAAARQARAAPDWVKASTILPVLAVAAIVLRRRR